MVAYRLAISIDRAASERDAGDALYREITSVMRQVLNRASVLTPVRFGNLRAHNQIRVRRVGNNTEAEIFNDTVYAPYVHDGVKDPTVIRPRHRKALRFVIDGKVVFAKKVTIPPRKGRPWMLRAIKEVAVARGYNFTPT